MIKEFLKLKNTIIISTITFVTLIASYLQLFISIPLNSDTTGAYRIGSQANLSYEWSLANGRWAKCISELFIEKIGYYNIVPFFTFILLLVVCMVFINCLNELFIFNNLVISIFISITFFITPAFVSLFSYFNDIYAHIIAILIGSIIIKKCFIENDWKLYILLLPLMMGFYQSYLCLICSIYIIYNIHLILNNRINKNNEKEYMYHFIIFIVLSILSVIVYCVINIICLRAFNVQSVLNDRFGYSLTFNSIINSILKMYGMIAILPFKNYAGLNTTLLMKIVFFVSFILIIVSLIRFIKNNFNKLSLFLILLLLILPISMNCVTLMSQHIVIQMTYGLGLIYLLLAVFYNYFSINIKNKLVKNVVLIFISVIIFHMIYFANGYTYVSKLVSDSTKSFVVELVSKIKNVDGYDPSNKVMLFGTINDNNLIDYYSYYDNDIFPIASPYNTMLYEEPDSNQAALVKQTEEFKNMSYYPNDNSIRIINDVVVVKFSD